MPALEKISTIDDMKTLMNELHRLEAKLLFEYYGVFQDFSAKKFLPQWLQKKGINKAIIGDSGNEALSKIKNSKKHALIVYDLETSDLNGLQFISEIDKNPEVRERCKLILACPQLAPDVLNKILHMGASAVVSKPLTEDGLQRAFEKIGLDY